MNKNSAQSAIRRHLSQGEFPSLCRVAFQLGGREVWLFGSALYDETPGDIDIAILMDDISTFSGISTALHDVCPNARIQRMQNYKGQRVTADCVQPHLHILVDSFVPHTICPVRQSLRTFGTCVWQRRVA